MVPGSGNDPAASVPPSAPAPAEGATGRATSWPQSRTALVIAVGTVVLGVLSFVAAAPYPDVSARAPRAVALLVVITATFLTVRSARDLVRGMREENAPLRRVANFADGSGTTLRITVVVTLYVAGLQLVGFIIATMVFLVVAAYLLGMRRILGLVALGPVATVVIYLVFTQLFGIRLPSL